jgi:predicted RNA-binding Zn ribbon-like protein
MVSVDWRDILLDLLNTTPVIDGRATDALDSDWLTAHRAAQETVEDVRRLRADLQRVVRGESGPEVLTGYLDGVRRVPSLLGDGVEWSTEAPWTGHLVLAWGELQRELPGRLRPCANDECRLFLLDRSRAGTARWCSMKICGNRMKARRHYDRVARSG